MRHVLIVAVLSVAAQACVSSAPPDSMASTPLRGTASWYGEEFAGRTTANGEIYDPLLLTAAHRTLPFGTVVTVKNVKSGQTVAVRINDRGPFVGARIIDLSYAAAEKIGMVEPGIGTVELSITKLGKGDREPPVPYLVSIPKPSETVRESSTPPPVEFPLPQAVPLITAMPEAGAAQTGEDGFKVAVTVERAGVPVRKQVSASGTGVEEVPATGPSEAGISTSASLPSTSIRALPAVPVRREGFVVQAGAFQVEQNARALLDKVEPLLGNVAIDQSGVLFRVRAGPFRTREQAIDAREKLETAGLSGIILAAE